MLAPGGVLRRPSTYGDRDRTVELEGEAYFVVTHDSTRPFAVHTSSVVARDLGTRFVVRAYPDEAATDVVVAEGAVAVGRTVTGTASAATRPLSSDSLVLAPRQRARLTNGGNMVLTQRVALDGYLGWTEGRLVFERTPLDEVVRQLGRWYGIDIGLADSALRGRRLTATLIEEHAAQAVDLVATSLQLSVSRSGNLYVLRAMR
jgi:transmembrane sensor